MRTVHIRTHRSTKSKVTRPRTPARRATAAPAISHTSVLPPSRPQHVSARFPPKIPAFTEKFGFSRDFAEKIAHCPPQNATQLKSKSSGHAHPHTGRQPHPQFPASPHTAQPLPIAAQKQPQPCTPARRTEITPIISYNSVPPSDRRGTSPPHASHDLFKNLNFDAFSDFFRDFTAKIAPRISRALSRQKNRFLPKKPPFYTISPENSHCTPPNPYPTARGAIHRNPAEFPLKLPQKAPFHPRAPHRRNSSCIYEKSCIFRIHRSLQSTPIRPKLPNVAIFHRDPKPFRTNPANETISPPFCYPLRIFSTIHSILQSSHVRNVPIRPVYWDISDIRTVSFAGFPCHIRPNTAPAHVIFVPIRPISRRRPCHKRPN